MAEDGGQRHSRRGGDRGRSAPRPIADGRSGRGRPVPSHPAPRPISVTGSASSASGRVFQIAQVMFRGVRTEYYGYRGEVPLEANEYVIVEADRGQDLGWIRRAVDGETHSCEGGCDHAHHGPVVPPARKVLRRASPADVERRLKLDDSEGEVRSRTRTLVQKHRLKMKVSEAEWQWDRNKLTIYFTAEKRVDFRTLVKEMARTFKTRIELRQIGVRDEAKRLGGIGRCGRELCCRLWLPEIEPVTLQLAKDQGLSLNPAQISGACGRLMSCLRYEHEQYVQARKRFPKVGKRLETSRGKEEVTGWDLFRETISLRGKDGEARTVGLQDLKAETATARRQRGRPSPDSPA